MSTGIRILMSITRIRPRASPYQTGYLGWWFVPGLVNNSPAQYPSPMLNARLVPVPDAGSGAGDNMQYDTKWYEDASERRTAQRVA